MSQITALFCHNLPWFPCVGSDIMRCPRPLTRATPLLDSIVAEHWGASRIANCSDARPLHESSDEDLNCPRACRPGAARFGNVFSEMLKESLSRQRHAGTLVTYLEALQKCAPELPDISFERTVRFGGMHFRRSLTNTLLPTDEWSDHRAVRYVGGACKVYIARSKSMM